MGGPGLIIFGGLLMPCAYKAAAYAGEREPAKCPVLWSIAEIELEGAGNPGTVGANADSSGAIGNSGADVFPADAALAAPMPPLLQPGEAALMIPICMVPQLWVNLFSVTTACS